METATIISLTIAVASATVAIRTVIIAYLKVKNSRNITLIKKDHTKITLPTQYNKAASRRLIEFIND